MTEEEWLMCHDPIGMLENIRDNASNRKLQLFCCVCCRRVWHLFSNQRSREVVTVAEQYVDGNATENEMQSATQHAENHFKSNFTHRNGPAYAAAYHCGWIGEPLLGAIRVYERLQRNVCPIATPLPDVLYCQLLHDIFGHLFQPTTINPAWLTPTVTNLANSTYEQRILPSGELETARLAILADALEESGCDNQEILGHLRIPGPHVRGCHVLDLLLGKE